MSKVADIQPPPFAARELRGRECGSAGSTNHHPCTRVVDRIGAASPQRNTMIAHLLQYDPYQELNQLSRRFFGTTTATRPEPARMPIDVREEDDRFVVEADVPGLAPEDLEIVATPERLVLKGSRKASNDNGTLRRERTEYSFERVLALPRGIDTSQIEATLDAGVLTVRLPKRAEDRPRTVAVKATTKPASE
jgi:HSP20 family protein